MKKFISGLLIGILMTASIGYAANLTAYYNPEIKVRVDGEYIDVTPVTAIEAGQTNGFNLLPVRTLGEALGYDVTFDSKTKVIDLDKPTIEDVAQNAESCVMIKIYKNRQYIAYGSGVYYEGYIITNDHVLDAGDAYTIEYNDYTAPYSAELVYTDNALDIGILKSPKKIKSVEFGDSDKVKVGDEVVLISSPREIKNSVSDGIISGIREWNGVKILQTTTNTSPGRNDRTGPSCPQRIYGYNRSVYQVLSGWESDRQGNRR
jgi:S1-C subfamily serine protease